MKIKTFFSKKRAENFAATLIDFESVTIWSGTDAFGQTVYTVKWY